MCSVNSVKFRPDARPVDVWVLHAYEHIHDEHAGLRGFRTAGVWCVGNEVLVARDVESQRGGLPNRDVGVRCVVIPRAWWSNE
jgi:hypothetical protein